MAPRKKKLGFLLKDEVAKVTFKTKHFQKKESEGQDDWKEFLIPNYNPSLNETQEARPWINVLFFALISCFFFGLFLRLFHLQITQGKVNRELADGNRIQIKIIHAPRGVIFDRNGKILASNSPAFRLLNKETGKVRLITREQSLELEAKQDPRFNDLEIDNVRTYPLGEQFTHVLGYVGQISEDQIKKPGATTHYKSGDIIGQAGIEAQYEDILKGIDGGEVIEVDSLGRKLRTLRRNLPLPGKNIYLTLDADLQQNIYQQIKLTLEKGQLCCASAVAMNPANGEVLALLSFPTFDPNIFTSLNDEQALNQVFNSPNSPLLNRPLGGTFPPGSTYKIVSSLAALASHKISPSTTFEDTGVMSLGPYKFTNWYFNQYGRTEGPVNLTKALQRSNDIYYYHVGQVVGEGGLIEWSKKLKLGERLGIDLPGEVTGLVPDDKWKRENFGEGWYPGDTLHMSIGQGFVLTTPLQVLGMTSFIAQDGLLFKPHLLLKVGADGEESKSEKIISDIVPQADIEAVKEGLKQVPKNGGTAWPFFTFPIETAGKTGTAEYGDPKGKTHAWYTAFAPVDNPTIVMTVLIESGGEGSSVASPIVKEAFRWYFSSDKSNLVKDQNFSATDSAKSLGE